MKATQVIVLEARTVKSKKTFEDGNAIIYNILYVVKLDEHDHFFGYEQFCSKNVFEMYSGPGVYDAEFTVVQANDGSFRPKLVSLKKVKGIEV